MKKVIAGIIALTTVICTFTGCGKDAADDAAGTSASTAAETTAAQEKTTDEEETSAASAETGTYEDAVKAFIEAFLANDRQKTLEMQYPDGIMDFVKVFMRSEESEEWTEEDVISLLQYGMYDDFDEDEKVTFKGIISAEPLRSDEESEIKEAFSTVKWAINYINEHGGPDKADPAELDEEWENLDYDEYPCEVDIEEGYYVTFEIEEDESETNEGTLYAVRIKGENGWKISIGDIHGNVKANRKDSLNSTASSLDKALNTALVEMDEEGKLPSSDKMFIASSDDSMNYNVPDDFDVEFLRKRARNYFEMIDELEWFAVINKGYVEYVAAVYPDDQQYVGTYPPNSIMNKAEPAEAYSDNTKKDEKADERTFKELYDISVEAIGK